MKGQGGGQAQGRASGQLGWPAHLLLQLLLLLPHACVPKAPATAAHCCTSQWHSPTFPGPYSLPSAPASLQSAVRYTESWCTLVARGRLHHVPAKYIRLVEAALGHPQLSAAQLDRLLATERRLPAEVTSAMNAWLAGWQTQVQRRKQRLAAAAEQQRRQQAASAAQKLRRARHAAAAALEPASSASCLPTLAGSLHAHA